MAKSLYLEFGGPTTAAHGESLTHWYEQHLEQMCSLPGITAAHLYRPSAEQMPRIKAKLPETLAIYEYDTIDHAGAAEALQQARSGAEDGAYEAGLSIPGPPENAYAPDPSYQSAYYNLASSCPQTPRGSRWDLTADTIFMVFGGPATPALEEEVMRWYLDAHLEEICSLAGISSGHFLRPSSVQLPDVTTKLPEVLAFYEHETDDLAATVAGMFAAHLEGMKRGEYHPGEAVPGPAEKIWTLNREHQSAHYELASRWAREQ